MHKNLVLLLIFTIIPIKSYATYIYEYLSGIEPLLKERNFQAAQDKFDALNVDVKEYSVGGFKDTITYLKQTDNVRHILEDANTNPSKYQADDDYAISLKNCSGRDCNYVTESSFQSLLPKRIPFSSEFVAYINEYNNSTMELFKKTNSQLLEIARLEEEKIAQEQENKRKAEEKAYTKKVEAERLAQKTTEAKEKKAKEDEILEIDNASKSIGLNGYSKENVVSLIYKTQQSGGLEKYLNTSVGCLESDQQICKRWYPKIKALQILDQGVLYSFSEPSTDGILSFIIYVKKEPNKIYQEEQQLENSFYKFQGMFTYQTALGYEKSVPFFIKIDLPYNKKP